MSYAKVVSVGFKETKSKVIEVLRQGRIQHETTRSGKIEEKNLLLVGLVRVEEVIELINGTKGTEYFTSKHHMDKSIEIHIFRPRKSGKTWYIKCYLLEPDIWFISVHH